VEKVRTKKQFEETEGGKIDRINWRGKEKKREREGKTYPHEGGKLAQENKKTPPSVQYVKKKGNVNYGHVGGLRQEGTQGR